MRQLSIALPDDIFPVLESAADRDCRTPSGQVRFYVIDGLRRSGHRNGAAEPQIGVPLPVTLEDMDAELVSLEPELRQLEHRQVQLGRMSRSLDPDDERRLSFLRSRITTLRTNAGVLRRMQGKGTNGHG